MSLSWRGRSLLRIAPALPALRRHGSGVGSSKNSQRNRHSAALRFPQLDFWTGIVSECPVTRPLKSLGAHLTVLPAFVFHTSAWTITRCCVNVLIPTEALCETIHIRVRQIPPDGHFF